MLSAENTPDDPPCSCNFSHLTSSGNELDQPLDHQHHLPNFSIRDYAFSIRSKDIKNSWPFSPKGLELCLRLGIKDPLPPFEPLESVSNQSSKAVACPIKTCSPEKQRIKSNVEKQTYAFLSDHRKLNGVLSDPKLAEPGQRLDHGSLRQSSAENDLPSTSFPKSEIDSAPFDRLPSKKSGLILRFRSTEDIASNCLATFDLMTSKTCPVCKTFSSASNTTLNAHIDQCLAADSAPTHSRPTSYRIKRRRIRLMTDVYATAKKCTLEELDRRNGTSWTMISSLPILGTNKSMALDERRKQRASQVHLDENRVVGSVYFNGSGKKLRNLSDLNDNLSRMSKEGKDVGIKNKSSKGGKRCKSFSSKKKRRLGKKRHKHLKISEGQEGSSEGSFEEEQQILKQVKLNQPRNLKHPLQAKGNSLTTKLNKKGCKWQLARNLPVGNLRSCSEDYKVMRNQVQTWAVLSKNTVSSRVNNFKSSEVHERKQTSVLRKRAQSPYFGGRVIKNNTNQFWQPPCSAVKNFFAEEISCLNASPSANSLKPSMLPPAFAPKASRFSSLWAKASSPRSQPSLTKYNTHVLKKKKKTRMQFSEEGDAELPDWESDMDHEFALTDGDTNDKGEEVETPINAFSSNSGDDNYDDDEKDEDDVNYGDIALGKTDEPATSGSKGFGPNISLDIDSCRSDSPPSTKICIDATILGEQEVYYADGVGNRISGQSAHTGMELECVAGQENSLTEVDPIPIPGPPGSFLPSPRDMSSDEFMANSSFTTTLIQSSCDQCDFKDRNSSESSVASIMSKSSRARLDNVDYSGIGLVQEKIPSSFSTVNFSSASEQTSTGAEQTSDREKFSVDRMCFERKPFGFGNNDQSCCCQGKERFLEDASLNHEDSQPLRQRAMSYVTLRETGRQIGSDPISKLNKSEAILNIDPQRKFYNGVVCKTVIPSASNPVLRLMGKNLMVVNKGEEASMSVPHGQAESSFPSTHLTPQFQDPSRTSSCRLPMTAQGSFPSLESSGERNNTKILIPQIEAQVQITKYHNLSIGEFR